MEPSAKNTLNKRDALHILGGVLVATLIQLLAGLVGLGDNLRHVMCAFGEFPCKMAEFVIPGLAFLFMTVSKYRAGEPKPAEPAAP